jgi:hypothetical protein
MWPLNASHTDVDALICSKPSSLKSTKSVFDSATGTMVPNYTKWLMSPFPRGERFLFHPQIKCDTTRAYQAVTVIAEKSASSKQEKQYRLIKWQEAIPTAGQEIPLGGKLVAARLVEHILAKTITNFTLPEMTDSLRGACADFLYNVLCVCCANGHLHGGVLEADRTTTLCGGVDLIAGIDGKVWILDVLPLATTGGNSTTATRHNSGDASVKQQSILLSQTNGSICLVEGQQPEASTTSGTNVVRHSYVITENTETTERIECVKNSFMDTIEFAFDTIGESGKYNNATSREYVSPQIRKLLERAFIQLPCQELGELASNATAADRNVAVAAKPAVASVLYKSVLLQYAKKQAISNLALAMEFGNQKFWTDPIHEDDCGGGEMQGEHFAIGSKFAGLLLRRKNAVYFGKTGLIAIDVLMYSTARVVDLSKSARSVVLEYSALDFSNVRFGAHLPDGVTEKPHLGQLVCFKHYGINPDTGVPQNAKLLTINDEAEGFADYLMEFPLVKHFS